MSAVAACAPGFELGAHLQLTAQRDLPVESVWAKPVVVSAEVGSYLDLAATSGWFAYESRCLYAV